MLRWYKSAGLARSPLARRSSAKRPALSQGQDEEAAPRTPRPQPTDSYHEDQKSVAGTRTSARPTPSKPLDIRQIDFENLTRKKRLDRKLILSETWLGWKWR